MINRDGARPCGCDPKGNHVCEGHLGHLDNSQTDVGVALGVNYPDGTVEPDENCLVVVGGPDEDGHILLLSAAEVYLPRFVAEDLANEILRRLKEQKG